MIKHHNKKQVGEGKVCLTCTSTFYSIIELNQRRLMKLDAPGKEDAGGCKVGKGGVCGSTLSEANERRNGANNSRWGWQLEEQLLERK